MTLRIDLIECKKITIKLKGLNQLHRIYTYHNNRIKPYNRSKLKLNVNQL